jgi:hypothetical protein
VRNRNAVISPGGATVALMNAFPNRYVRDAQGTLGVDRFSRAQHCRAGNGCR